MTPPTTQTGMEKRLHDVLVKSHDAYGTTYPPNPELIAFIRSEITKAVEAERERIEMKIRSLSGNWEGETMEWVDGNKEAFREILYALTTLTKEEK